MTAEAIEVAAPSAPAVRHLHSVAQRPYVPLVICRCGHETDAHDGACDVCGSVRCHGFRRRTGRSARSSFRP